MPNFSRISEFPGRLIIFEWSDGSGKSTQARKVRTWLRNQGEIGVIVNWKDAPYFRDFFVTSDTSTIDEGMTPEAHLFLQVADFLYQIEKKVIPNLLKGHTVIMDRAVPTIIIRWLSIGYSLDQLKNGLLWTKNTIYKDLFEKATTVYFDVNARNTLERIKKRSGKKWESGEGTLLSFQMINNMKYLPDGEKLTKRSKRKLVEKLQETYITSYGHYFSHHPHIHIDANQNKDTVHEQVLREVFGVNNSLLPVTSTSKDTISKNPTMTRKTSPLKK